jgi:glucosamine-phosphate N-acetyltransferase
MDDYIIRDINNIDFYNGYLELMYEFTNYKYDLSYKNFIEYLDKMKDFNKIFIIYSNIENKIIGTGSIFKIIKLHNNPIGQIEDVIINNKYRSLGLGKIIVNKLIQFGLNEFKCYKIILNCLDKNINFYEKCGFILVGNEMKYLDKL